jgi:PKD domain
MKIKLLNAVLAFAVIFVSGCRSPAYKSTQAALMAAAPTIPTVQTSLYDARQQEILTLQSDCDQNQKDFEKQADKVTGQANFFGISQVGISWAGLGSGIAATALTVASPANAVWTTIMAGFAGGSAGFAAAAAQQGFSKAAIAQSMAPILQMDAYAYTNFSTAKLIDLAIGNADIATWTQEYATQSHYVSLIRMAALQLKSPYIPPAPPTSVPPALVADFTASPSGTNSLTVDFTDHSSPGVTLWIWDFGDSQHTSSTKQNPSFTYASSGNYTVTLSVAGNAGTPNSKSETITVQ